MSIGSRETLIGHLMYFKPNFDEAISLYKKNVLKISLFTLPQVALFLYIFTSIANGHQALANLIALLALNFVISATFIKSIDILIKSDISEASNSIKNEKSSLTDGLFFGLQHLILSLFVFGLLDILAGNQLLHLIDNVSHDVVGKSPWHSIIILVSSIIAINIAFFSFLPSVFANILYTYKKYSSKKAGIMASRMIFRERENLFFYSIIFGSEIFVGILLYSFISPLVACLYIGVLAIPFIICLNYVISKNIVHGIDKAIEAKGIVK